MKKDASFEGGSRREYWLRQAEAWRSSGLSQAAFARQSGLKVNTFRWWLRRIEEPESRFVEVPELAVNGWSGKESDGVGIRLHLGAVIVELSKGYDEQTLERLLSLLGGNTRCS